MWYLLFWVETKESTIVDQKCIIQKKFSLGDLVDVKYGDELWKGKVLRKCKKKSFLESLFVSEDGEVNLPIEQSTVQLPMKIKVMNGKKNGNKTKKKVEPNRNIESLDRIGKKNHDPSAKTVRQSPKFDDSASEITHQENDDYEESSDEECIQQPEFQSETIGPENNEFGRNLTDIDVANCRLCQVLPVSVASLRLFEHWLAHLRAKVERENRVIHSNQESCYNEPATEGIPAWKMPDDTKVELVSGSGIWISKADLDHYENVAEGDPGKMTRSLLKGLIKIRTLTKSCVLGGSKNTTAVDPTLRKTIDKYVRDKFCKGKPLNDFNQTINRMCSRLRYTEKKKDGNTSENNQSIEGKSTMNDNNKKDIDSEEKFDEEPPTKRKKRGMKMKSFETGVSNVKDISTNSNDPPLLPLNSTLPTYITFDSTLPATSNSALATIATPASPEPTKITRPSEIQPYLTSSTTPVPAPATTISTASPQATKFYMSSDISPCLTPSTTPVPAPATTISTASPQATKFYMPSDIQPCLTPSATPVPAPAWAVSTAAPEASNFALLSDVPPNSTASDFPQTTPLSALHQPTNFASQWNVLPGPAPPYHTYYPPASVNPSIQNPQFNHFTANPPPPPTPGYGFGGGNHPPYSNKSQIDYYPNHQYQNYYNPAP